MFFDGLTITTNDYCQNLIEQIATSKEEVTRTVGTNKKVIYHRYKLDKLDAVINSKGVLTIMGSPLVFINGNNYIPLTLKEYYDVLDAFIDTLGLDRYNTYFNKSEFFTDIASDTITPMEFVPRCFFHKNRELKHQKTRSHNSEYNIAERQNYSVKVYVKANKKVRIEVSNTSSHLGLSYPPLALLYDEEFYLDRCIELTEATKNILFAEPFVTHYPECKNDIKLLEAGSNKLYWKKPNRLRNYKKRFKGLQETYTTNLLGSMVEEIENKVFSPSFQNYF